MVGFEIDHVAIRSERLDRPEYRVVRTEHFQCLGGPR